MIAAMPVAPRTPAAGGMREAGVAIAVSLPATAPEQWQTQSPEPKP
jgi:hypothetical protein